MNSELTYYVNTISKMRTDSGKTKYPDITQNRAPHKPILLLAIFDLFEQAEITQNFVPISPILADLFTTYWELVMPPERIGHLFLPFFHMKNDAFWHLVPHHGKETVLRSIKQIGGSGQLRNTAIGAEFDDELFKLIIAKETRDVLRETIITTYFSQNVRPLILSQARMNKSAHFYSIRLLKQARVGAVESENDTDQPTRDIGFRKAIVAAYNHRCVLCGVRLVTYEGRTAATAAHIIPWSVSYNDNPRNGLCLCRLCHWAFDVGLATISTQYRIRLSPQVNAEGNRSGYLSTLEDRPIFEAVEDAFNPNIDALKWHNKHVFLG